MKIFKFAYLLSGLLLAGCLPRDSMKLFLEQQAAEQTRYSIDSYTEDTTLDSDLTGLWMAIHSGTRKETVDGVDYTISGNIREVVEVTRSNGVYYLRTCRQPQQRNALSVSGTSVSVTMNDDLAKLTTSSNTAMSGTASHSDSNSSYTGNVAMKKITATGDTFGIFNYLNNNLGKDVATASCFQEGSVYVVGKKSVFTKSAYAEMAYITDWSAATFKQTQYLFSLAGGTADPVSEISFSQGSLGADPVVRKYSLKNNDKVSVSVTSTSLHSLLSSFNVNGVIAGSVSINY